MAFQVKSSEEAASDVSDIIRYIHDDLCNPQAAERFYNAINEKFELLGENPFIYPLYHDKKLSEEGYRYAIIGNYLMFYLVDEGNSIVNIARIVYGARNISVVFSNN